MAILCKPKRKFWVREHLEFPFCVYSVMYFQWRKSRGSSEKFHGAVVDHDRSIENRTFKDVAKVGQTLEKLDAIVGTMPDSKVAILYDWESNWALDDAQGFGLDSKRYPQTLQQHYKAFWERDVSVDVITKEQDVSKYKLLVVPMLYLMQESLMDRFKAYVENGGTLVMTYMSGLVDACDLVYMQGWPKPLQDIFGMRLVETDTYYPKDRNVVKYHEKSYEVRDYASILEVSDATILGTFEQDFYAGGAAVTKHGYGKGQAYFIGARLEHGFHVDFYGNLLDELEISPAAHVRHKKGVSVQVRQDEAFDYVFIMNFTEKTQCVELGFEAEDMLTQETVSGEVIFEQYGVRVLKKKKD